MSDIKKEAKTGSVPIKAYEKDITTFRDLAKADRNDHLTQADTFAKIIAAYKPEESHLFNRVKELEAILTTAEGRIVELQEKLSNTSDMEVLEGKLVTLTQTNQKIDTARTLLSETVEEQKGEISTLNTKLANPLLIELYEETAKTMRKVRPEFTKRGYLKGSEEWQLKMVDMCLKYTFQSEFNDFI